MKLLHLLPAKFLYKLQFDVIKIFGLINIMQCPFPLKFYKKKYILNWNNPGDDTTWCLMVFRFAVLVSV